MPIIIILTILANFTTLSAMEIEHIVKDKSTSEKSSLIKNQQQQYTQTTNKKYPAKTLQSFTYNIVHMPQDVRAIIYKNLFEIDNERAQKITKIPTGIVLKYVYEIEEHCPFTIGNKTFEFMDLLNLTQEQRNDLLNMTNPFWIKHETSVNKKNIALLRKMPEHITENLIVDMLEWQQQLWGSASDSQRGRYCSGAAMFMGACGLAGLTSLACTNSLFYIGGGFLFLTPYPIVLGVSLTNPAADDDCWTAHCLPCCVEIKKVNVK